MTYDGLVTLWQAGFVPLAICLAILLVWLGLSIYDWWLSRKRRG